MAFIQIAKEEGYEGLFEEEEEEEEIEELETDNFWTDYKAMGDDALELKGGRF